MESKINNIERIRTAAVQGHAPAQAHLGLMYMNGHGVTKDYSEAMKWFHLAAKQGIAEAQNKLDILIKMGIDISKVNTEAKALKKRPAICAVCRKTITGKEMEKSVRGDLMGDLQGANFKYMPNLIEGLAMKCNKCGIWICIHCAENAAMSAGAGMIKHSDCGGMFESP